MAQEIFERYEKKYMLTMDAYRKLVPELMKHMTADRYGKYTISNIYFDTEDFRLIRESLAKPVYKEKLRLRLYGDAAEDGTVFAEIKKKYKGVVYKRRIPLSLKDARRYLVYGIRPDLDRRPFTERQIFREVDYMKERYGLKPAVFIAYDRIAFAGTDDPELRVTFDNNIRCRRTELDLAKGKHGTQLLAPGTILMEVKIPGAMPLWMAKLFEDITKYEVSFSKYGTYYKRLMEEKTETEKEDRRHAA